MVTDTIFTIENRFGDYIQTRWRNILDCILRLHKLGLSLSCVASDAAEDPDLANDSMHGKPLSRAPSMSQFSNTCSWYSMLIIRVDGQV